MSKRKDDFPQAVRTAVARRASHHCSFRDCPQVTVGPSDEGPLSVATTGVAAHIHAASPGPGARRYLATMSSDERKTSRMQFGYVKHMRHSLTVMT